MPLRRLALLTVMGAAALGAWQPAAQAGSGTGTVDVVEVSGPIDGRMVDFVERSIRDSDAILVVLQIDSPAAVDGDARRLVELAADPPVPLVVWVGPEPAVAYGIAAQMLAVAPIGAASPGVAVGYLAPSVGGADDAAAVEQEFAGLSGLGIVSGRLVVGIEPIPGLVDVVSPSVGQLVVGLDGTTLVVRGEQVTLETAVSEIDESGVEVVKPAGDVRFSKPGLITRSLRLAIDPETAFLFLVTGLAFIVFETYAAGPGVAAGVGVLALLIAGYGLAVLPVRWWAVAATLAGVLAYAADFQRNDLGWRSVLGTALLLAGGLALVDGGSHIDTSWWAVVLVVLAAALFFGFALTTVARARFSTATIGRDHLIGRSGVAGSDFDPEGVVVVDGARWRAKSARASGIAEGDPVLVVAIDGIVLEVEPGLGE